MPDFSFDIVSEVDLQEMDNAVNQAVKELSQRYDFKNTKASITYDKKEKKITLVANDEYGLKSLKEMLGGRMVKRGISIKALKFNEPEKAFEGHLRQLVEINIGIQKEKAKELTGIIKGLGLKVQTHIEGEKVRVSSPKKDDLQTVIAHVRALNFSIPLGFTNYR